MYTFHQGCNCVEFFAVDFPLVKFSIIISILQDLRFTIHEVELKI